jgi:putative MATE family efflux protein
MRLHDHFVIESHFFKVLLGLALPIALQDLIKFSLALTDNLMVGNLSQEALSAVTLANQPFFVFSLLSFGMASGGGILTAQYYGKHDAEAISRTVSITLSVGLLVAFLFGAITLLFPAWVMGIFTADPVLIDLGSQYLQIQGWTYFLFGFTNTLIMLMRSTRDVKMGLIITTGTLFLNMFFNWVLIFGHLGMPALGVRGAAIGTLCARIIECGAIILYIRFMDRHLHFRFLKLFHFDKILLRDFVRYSLPVAINEGGWSLGIAAQSVVLGHMSASVVAASSIVGTAQQIALVLIFGVAGASAPILGNLLGSGKNLELVKPYANTLLAAGIAVGILASLTLYASKDLLIPLYHIPETTKTLAVSLLSIQCLIIITQSYTTPAIVGILRSGGDTLFTSALDIGCLWLFSIPLGYLAGFYWALPIPLIFFILHSDEIVKIPILIWRVQQKKWIRNITH